MAKNAHDEPTCRCGRPLYDLETEAGGVSCDSFSGPTESEDRYRCVCGSAWSAADVEAAFDAFEAVPEAA